MAEISREIEETPSQKVFSCYWNTNLPQIQTTLGRTCHTCAAHQRIGFQVPPTHPPVHPLTAAIPRKGKSQRTC